MTDANRFWLRTISGEKVNFEPKHGAFYAGREKRAALGYDESIWPRCDEKGGHTQAKKKHVQLRLEQAKKNNGKGVLNDNAGSPPLQIGRVREMSLDAEEGENRSNNQP